MIKNKITNIFLALSLSILLFGSGYKIGVRKARLDTRLRNSFSQNQAGIDFTLFWDVWDKINKKFVDKEKLKSKNMFYGAIKGVVASLGDPYTFFMTPEENKKSKDDLSGKFQGIGAQLGLKDNQIIIVAPLKDSPAKKAGVVAGDIILKVNDESTKGWTLTQAVTKIRGEKGTKVVLTLGRDGKEIIADIVRDEINIPSVELTYEKRLDCKKNCPEVAYLKLSQFGENTKGEWDKAIGKIILKKSQNKIKGIVLDLRNNPGGYLKEAVYFASEFLPKNKLIVKQEASTPSLSHNYYSTRKGALTKIPLVVLINRGSASASEILAGALSDYKRAKLVGEKSFGKGSVQEALDLDKGAGLHVTIAKWILPNGQWINKKGIIPDIKIKNEIPKGNTLNRSGDKQLETAIRTILK